MFCIWLKLDLGFYSLKNSKILTEVESSFIGNKTKPKRMQRHVQVGYLKINMAMETFSEEVFEQVLDQDIPSGWGSVVEWVLLLTRKYLRLHLYRL